MRRFPLFVIALFMLAVSGCAIGDALRTPVDTAAAESKVAQWEQTLVDLRGFIAKQTENIAALQSYIADQDNRLAEARKIAEESKSAAALAVVHSLEQLKSEAQASLIHVQGLLGTAEKYLPQAEEIAAKAHSQLDELKQGGEKVPLWVMLGTLALPWIPKLASLIPGAGPVLAPVVGQLAESLWHTLATKQQKDADALIAARSAALDHQVQVTHDLIAVAGDKADPVLEAAKSRQIAAGVHATLLPLVATLEAKAV